MTPQHGKIPDHILQELNTSQTHTHGICDECGSECRVKVEHPNKRGVFICQQCEADIFMEQEGLDPEGHTPEKGEHPDEFED